LESTTSSISGTKLPNYRVNYAVYILHEYKTLGIYEIATIYNLILTNPKLFLTSSHFLFGKLIFYSEEIERERNTPGMPISLQEHKKRQ
jgi:hypothetical protein